jgi:Zn-dependent protease with chaperone function
MKNYIWGVAAVVLVICVCVMAIHYEGEQTRESMRKIARDELNDLVEEGVNDTFGSGGKLPKPRNTLPGGGDSEPPSKESTTDSILGNVIDSMPRPPKATDVVDGVFGTAREVINSGEETLKPYVELSISEEQSLGRRFHREVLQEYDVVKDTALYDRIDEAAGPLLRNRRRRGMDYTFTVVKSDPDDLNAFSIVGGYVYIHSAMMDFVKNDLELQSLLGHEIGHVDLGHCAHRQGMDNQLSGLGGSLAAGLHRQLAAPYSQQQEYQADEYGFRAVIAAGHTREEALEFERRFAKHNKLRGLGQPVKKKSDRSLIGVLRENINSHFISHPYDDDRVKRLEAIDINSPPSF